MKSNTALTILGIIVLLAIIWGVYLYYKKSAVDCQPGFHHDLVTGQCVLNDSSTSRTTQKDYCERHGGTWDGEKCIAYADPNRIIIVNPKVVPIPTNPINPAGGRPGLPK